MPLKLWCYTIHCAEGRNGDQFAFGRSELVAGVDVAKKVRLHVVVGLWTERIVPWRVPLITGLHFRADLQCQLGVVPNGRAMERLPLIVDYPR